MPALEFAREIEDHVFESYMQDDGRALAKSPIVGRNIRPVLPGF